MCVLALEAALRMFGVGQKAAAPSPMTAHPAARFRPSSRAARQSIEPRRPLRSRTTAQLLPLVLLDFICLYRQSGPDAVGK